MNGPLLKSQAPRFASVIKALFNTKGASVLDALPLVAPSFELTSELPDIRAWKGEFLWSSLSSGTAAAAQFPTVWLSTTDTSLLVIEQLIVQSATAQRIQADVTGVAFPAAPVTVQFDDKRVKGARFAGVHKFTSEVALTANPTRLLFNVQANVPVVLPVKYIVCGQRPQGTPAILQLQGQTALTDIIVMARGYGRVLEDTELAP